MSTPNQAPQDESILSKVISWFGDRLREDITHLGNGGLGGAVANRVGSDIGTAVMGADKAASFALTGKTDGGGLQAGLHGATTYLDQVGRGVNPSVAAKRGQEAQAAVVAETAKQGGGLSGGPLGPVMTATDAAWSYGVARPASTALLAANPASPLYKDQTIDVMGEQLNGEAGFQWSDLIAAWNRSGEVSFGKAAATLPLYERNPIAALAPNVFGLQDDGQVYDPWSDASMAEAAENPFFNALSGSSDLALNLVGTKGFGVAKTGITAVTGLRTAVKSFKDISALREQEVAHNLFAATNGAQGKITPVGKIIDALTVETNPIKVRRAALIANSTGADKGKLANIIANTNDRGTVAELVFANYGDPAAINQLMSKAPDHVWALGNMDETIRNAAINGEPRFAPVGDDFNKVKQIFDSAVSRDDYFAQVRDLFTSRKGNLLGQGSTWMPTKRMTVERIRKGINDMQYAISEADYDSAPRWVQAVASNKLGGPTTIFLQHMGSRVPLGRVSLSGVRPDDIWQEINATFDSVPAFRGNRPVVTDFNLVNGELVPVTVDASKYRQSVVQRMMDANANGNVKATWQQIEDEMVTHLAHTVNVDPKIAHQFVAGYRESAAGADAYMAAHEGYLFDEMGNAIVVGDAPSQRQMIESFSTLPFGDLYKELSSVGSPLAHAAHTLGGTTEQAFDFGMKFFRTNMLFRIGYTGKNSFMEVILSGYLAHGKIATEEGFASTLRNFGTNRVNNAKAIVFRTELDTAVKKFVSKAPVESRRELRSKLGQLADQRWQTQRVIDNAQGELDAIANGIPDVNKRAQLQELNRLQMLEAQIRLNQIDHELDATMPAWRQVVEPTHLVGLRSKLREYDAMLGNDPAYVDSLRTELGDIYTRANANAVRPTDDIASQLVSVEDNIAQAEAELAKLETSVDHVSVAASKPVEQVPKTVPQTAAVKAAQRKIEQQVADEIGIPVKRLYVDPRSRQIVNQRLRAIHDADIANIDTDFVYKLRKAAEIDVAQELKVPISELYSHPAARRMIIEKASPEYKAANGRSFGEDLTTVTRSDATKAPVRTPENPDYYKGQGRDYGAISIQRRLDSLRKQRDMLDEQLQAMHRTGVDAFTDFKMSVNDTSRANQIEQQLARIEGIKPEDAAKIQGKVDELRDLYNEIANNTHLNGTVTLSEVDKAVKKAEAIDAEMRTIVKKLGVSLDKISAVTGPRGFKGSGRGMMTLNVGGETFHDPAAFADTPMNFGSGYAAEASSAHTQALTRDPSYYASRLASRLETTGRAEPIGPNDPKYWDSLAHAANRYFRDDPLINEILLSPSGSMAGPMKFLMTPEGRAYQKHMGRDYLVRREATTLVDPLPRVDAGGSLEKVSSAAKRNANKQQRVVVHSSTDLEELQRIVHQYFPDPAVRTKIYAGEVTGSELQKMMGDNPNLSRILGDEMQYVPKSPLARMGAATDDAFSAVWNVIAVAPENKIARWPFYQREFKAQMELRANMLHDQGISMLDGNARDALRQAARRAALQELEKTFYNIRRYNNPVYTSRFLLSFPGAFFNSIYRYGRFAAKDPARLFQTSVLAGDMLKNFGVDADGNPVTNLNDAVYLLVPGTKKGPEDAGIRIPVLGFTSLTVNYPSLSWAATAITSYVTGRDPAMETRLRGILGDQFNVVFPYGINENPIDGFLSGYQRDAIRAFRGMSDPDFAMTSVQIFADNMANWEKNGFQGPQPTYEDAMSDTRAFYWSRAALKQVNSFPTDKQAPGALMRNAFYDMRQKHGGDVQAARAEFMQLYGNSARWYTFSTGDYTAYVPSTQEAYKRIWVDYPDLARSLKGISGSNQIDFVGLLALGTDGVFSQSVSNFLKNNALPGDNQSVVERMTPEDFENMVKVNDGWAVYSRSKVKLDAEQTRLRAMRDIMPNGAAKDVYRNQLKNNQDAFDVWTDQLAASNPAWGVDRQPSGNKAEQAAVFLNKIISDPKFSKNEGKQPLWQGVSRFLRGRESALAAIKDADNMTLLPGMSSSDVKDRKNQIMGAFDSWVRNDLLIGAPEFASAYQRYFAKEWTTANGNTG